MLILLLSAFKTSTSNVQSHPNVGPACQTAVAWWSPSSFPKGGSNFGEFGLAYYDVVPPFQAEERNVEL